MVASTTTITAGEEAHRAALALTDQARAAAELDGPSQRLDEMTQALQLLRLLPTDDEMVLDIFGGLGGTVVSLHPTTPEAYAAIVGTLADVAVEDRTLHLGESYVAGPLAVNVYSIDALNEKARRAVAKRGLDGVTVRRASEVATRWVWTCASCEEIRTAAGTPLDMVVDIAAAHVEDCRGGQQ